jgi:hypothetical protein
LNTTITGRGTAAWSKTKTSRGRDRFTNLRRTEIANRLCQVGRVEQVLNVNRERNRVSLFGSWTTRWLLAPEGAGAAAAGCVPPATAGFAAKPTSHHQVE